MQSPDVNNNNNAPPSDDDDDGSRQQQVAARRRDDPEAFTERLGYTHIDCVVNDEYKVDCRREADEVFVPFAFIKKYFDVSSVAQSCVVDCLLSPCQKLPIKIQKHEDE